MDLHRRALGIVTVRTRAFRADDALALASAIVRLSEKLANDVTARARADTMRRAEDEVRRSEGLVRDALQDIAPLPRGGGLH